MKNTIIIIAMLLIASLVQAQNIYYVQDPAYNENASDDNVGTDIDYPWATWQHAFDTAEAGDTVYFRGGIWYPTQTPRHAPPNHGNNGTEDNLIVFRNYPGETPITDGSNFPTTTSAVSGLSMYGSTYIKFQGLTITNTLETTNGQAISGGTATYVGTVYWEDVTSRSNGGHGFQWAGYDAIYVTRCDSYENADISELSPGNRADGFAGGSGGTQTDTYKVAYYTECRAWLNSDDGFDFGTTKQFQAKGCWSFSNGYLEDGTGVAFKTNPSHVAEPRKRRIHNCLAAYNKSSGFYCTNLNDLDYGPVVEFVNNTSYYNFKGFVSAIGDFNCASGGLINVIYQNNVVYHSQSDLMDQYSFKTCDEPTSSEYVTQSHNTWVTRDSGSYWAYNSDINWAYSGKDYNFISVTDSASTHAELSAPRKADGSLPDITFMKLSATSSLIDAGIDVGLPYNGSAPDLGYSEYDEAVPVP
jgi:hypothetical protein